MKTLSRSLAAYFRPSAPKSSGHLHRTARQKSQRLAATLYVQLETSKGEAGVNVWPTRRVDVDPFEGDHYAQDWADALQRVQTYAGITELVK